MNDTPRTEKAREQYWVDVYEKGFVVAEPVHASFARSLERENAELQKDKERLACLLARLYENTTPELRAIYRDDFDEAMNQPTQ